MLKGSVTSEREVANEVLQGLSWIASLLMSRKGVQQYFENLILQPLITLVALTHGRSPTSCCQ